MFSELSGEIINNEVVADTLDYGICMVGDVVSSKFILKNTGDDTLKLGPIRPSLSIEQYGGPEHAQDHEEFLDNLGSVKEIIIPPGKTSEIRIRYQASSDIFTYPFGLKIAKLTLGLYDSKIAPPQDTLKYVAYTEVILLARKVEHYISAYTNIVNFDSVYINSDNPPHFNWKVVNASRIDLTIDTQKLDLRTPFIPPTEIMVDSLAPIDMPAKSPPTIWKIQYRPHNLGIDSAKFTLHYNYSDTSDIAKIDIIGIGVEQKADIIETDASSYSSDTLNIGRVWVDSTKKVYAIISNSGNCPFNIKSQTIYKDLEGESPSDNFHIIEFMDNSLRFRPKIDADTVLINFKPDRQGLNFARYVIKTDISERNISGIPPDKRNIQIFLKGEGIIPHINTESDTFNFGNVVWHSDCPSSSSMTVKIENTGNTDLIISSFDIDLPYHIKFFSGNPINIIPAYGIDSIKVIFSPNQQKDYFAILRLVTNAYSPQDTFKLYFKASMISPANISLTLADDLKSQPGNNISIPIVIDSESISKARVFRTELTFNRTLLNYFNYNKINSAVANCDDRDINITQQEDAGRVTISIETPDNNTYFLPKDTLIKLVFHTYLGNKISTPIAFIEPIFGDGVCDKVLLPLPDNGLFSIDSVCGLPYKLIPNGTGTFLIGDIKPNPASEKIKLNFQLKYEIPLKIDLFNNQGQVVLQITNKRLSAGNYTKEINTSGLIDGVYYLKFSSGIFTKTKKIIIAR